MKLNLKEKKNKQKGITLVALVITIIILLILAGISIQALSQQGLFGQAKRAKSDTENAQREENEILENYVAKMEEITGGASGGESGGNQGSAESSTSTTHTATEIPYSWDEISIVAHAISNNSSINENTVEVNVTLKGQTKTIGVGDTKTLDGKQVRILGFNHDTLANETAYGTRTATGKAGISFEYVEILTSTEMNIPATNENGWSASAIRSTLNGDTYNSLSIKSNIKQVNKEYIQTYNDANTKTTCSDYLWLLSCGEIWDNGYNGDSTQNTRGRAIATEGKQYKYYKLNLGSTSYFSDTDITKKLYTSNSVNWWLRSPCYDYNVSFCYVASGGNCYYDMSTYSRGVAPGFSI